MRATVKAHLPGDSKILATPHTSGHKKKKKADGNSRKDTGLPRDAQQCDSSGEKVAISLSELEAP